MACVGTCDQMCPLREAELRSRMKRLSFFELSKKTGYSVDLSFCVKEYSRPAAGTSRSPDELRTPKALRATADYLFSLLDIDSHGKSLLYTSNFISDRLRAVRQDVIIQQLSCYFAVPILEKTVRYHILLKFMLHTESISNFDPTLNDQMLRCYLGDLLEYYTLTRYMGGTQDMASVLKNCDEFESYNVLLNFKDSNLILSVMKKYVDLKTNKKMMDINGTRTQHSINLAVCFHSKNYFRVFANISRLTFLESCCLLYEYLNIRFLFVSHLNFAFSSKHFHVPVAKVKVWLKFDNDIDTCCFLEKFNVDCNDGKISFDSKNKMVDFGSEKEKHEFAKKFQWKELITSKREVNDSEKDIVEKAL